MKYVILPVVLLLSSMTTHAQPFTLDPAIKPVSLVLHPFAPKDKPIQKGRMSLTKVTQVKDTLFYVVEGASIYSPVYVGVNSFDPANKITVQVSKMNWKNADRRGTTDDKGHWHEKFKTENDFGIMIIPETKPAKYTLTVWVGDESKFELPAVMQTGKDATSKVAGTKGKGGMSTILYVVIGVLALAVVFLFLKLKNRKP